MPTQTDKRQKEFEKELMNFENEIDAEVLLLKIITARYAARRLAKESPVWQGTYVKSHRVGLGSQDKSHEPIPLSLPGFLPPKASSAKAAKFKQRAVKTMHEKILNTKLGEKIVLSNSVPYADQVEFLGWMKTSAHHTYGKTMLGIKTNAKRLSRLAASNMRKMGKRIKKRSDIGPVIKVIARGIRESE